MRRRTRTTASDALPRHLLGQTLAISSTTGVAAVSGFAFWIVAGLRSPIAAVGALAVAAPLGHLAGAVASTGAPALLALRLPGLGTSARLRLVLRSAASAAAAGLALSLGLVLALGIGGDSRTLVLVTGPLVAVAAVMDGTLVALGRAWLTVLRSTVFGAARVALVLWDPSALELAWGAALLVSAVVGAAAAAVTLAFGAATAEVDRHGAPRSGLDRRAAVLAQMTSMARTLPLMLAPWFVERATDEAGAAIFYMGLQIAVLSLTVPEAGGAAALARAMRGPDQGDRTFGLATRLVVGSLTVMTVGTLLLAPFVLARLGSGYGASMPVVAALVGAAWFEARTSVTVARLRAAGRHGVSARVRLVGAAVSVAGVAVLAPSGALPAAVGLGAGMVAAAALTLAPGVRRAATARDAPSTS